MQTLYRPRQPIAGDLICHTVLWMIDGHRQLQCFATRPEAEAHAKATEGVVHDIRTTLPTATPALTMRPAVVEPDPDGTRLMVVTTADGRTPVGELEINPDGSVCAYRVNTVGHRTGLGCHLGTTDTTEQALDLLAADFHIDYQAKLCDQALNQFHIDLNLGLIRA